MKIVGDDVILSTKKTFYANNGILGISYYTDDFEKHRIAITEGYDGGVEDKRFSQRERKEIANYAITLWREWVKGA